MGVTGEFWEMVIVSDMGGKSEPVTALERIV